MAEEGAQAFFLIDDAVHALAELEAYSAAVKEQHSRLVAQIQQLVEHDFTKAQQSTSELARVASKLQALFTEIDTLAQVLDNVHEKTTILHECVKTIESPGSATAGFFRKLGAAVTNSNDTGVWSRVPPNILLDGSTPKEFAQRVRGVLSDLDHPQRHKK